MIDNNDISSLKTLVTDFLIVALTFSLLLVVMTIISIMIIGSREEGMGFGVIFGFIGGLGIFYYLRGHFSLGWTIAQVIVNAGLTIGEFYIFSNTFDGSSISEASNGYILIIILVPTLVSVNRQLIDVLTIQLKGQLRK